MFFRRPRPVKPTFEERLQRLRQSGFEIERRPDGLVLASRDGCAVLITDELAIERTGSFIGGEIAALVDGGYQKFWRTPSGRQEPALAPQLNALHAVEADARAALGLVSFYNTSLGTTNASHAYDRLEGRGGR